MELESPNSVDELLEWIDATLLKIDSTPFSWDYLIAFWNDEAMGFADCLDVLAAAQLAGGPIRRPTYSNDYDETTERLRRQVRDRLQQFRKNLLEHDDHQWDAATEARNKWIYDECIKGTVHETIILKMRRKPNAWDRIESVPGIRDAAARYAKRHNLPLPPRRHAGRRKLHPKI